MASVQPMTSEAIALTEKKMNMSLDDIIKMSKNKSNRNKKQRFQNKNKGVFKGNAGKENPHKVLRYLDSRSSIRQCAFAQRRSNFRGNQFPVITEVAKKATGAPICNRFVSNNGIVYRNQYRVGPSPIQRKSFGQDIVLKEQVKAVPIQKPSTLDERFANLREQRIKLFPAQNNSRRVGGRQQQLQRGRNQSGK